MTAVIERTTRMSTGEARLACNVVVVQPTLPRYRWPLFERLASRVDSLTVVHGHRRLPGETVSPGHRLKGVSTIAVGHEVLGPVFWMPTMWHVAGDRRWNLAVFGWNARYAHLPASLIRARRLGTGVVLWGHGYSTSDDGSLRRTYRNHLARWADAVVTYNHGAARKLIDEGMAADRVFVAPNALDGDAIERAMQSWNDRPEALREFQARLGVQGCPIALHVSRLKNARRLRTLVDTWTRIVAILPRARLVIVGDGPARNDLDSMVRESGLSGSIIPVGPAYDEHEVAPYFMMARLLLHPVKIGLALNHAMGYGVPVATFADPAHQNPEFEALQDGVNGVLAADGDVDALARRAVEVLGDERLAARLGTGARETMHTRYALDTMVDGFLAAIRHAHLASASRRRGGQRALLASAG